MTAEDIINAYGKDLGNRMIEAADKKGYSEAATIDGENLKVGGESMRGFYDQILPRFMDKYGKNWGIKTHDVNLPYLESSAQNMHAIDVTTEMRESVLQGQPMFQKVEKGKYQKEGYVSKTDVDEVKEMKGRMMDWLSEDNLSQALGKSRDEIFKLFDGDTAYPIAYVPEEWLGYLGEDITDNRIYSSKGYFIDHAINHHPSISSEKYQNTQTVLDNPDAIKEIELDGQRSVVFIKKIDRHNAVVVQLEKTNDGKIIWHKSFYDPKKEPYKNLPNLKEAKPLGNGGIPISRTEESAPGSNRLSTPNGLNASESKDSKSSSNLQTNEEKNDLFRLQKTFKDGQRIEITKGETPIKDENFEEVK